VTTQDGKLLAGRYRLLDQLGRGGMGTVWRAHDEVLGREVAVKEVLLPPSVDAATHDDLVERTRREARLAARLNHPNVVTVFDVVEEEGRPWVVMELVPSRSLTQVVEAEGPMTPQAAAAVGLQLLAALEAAHRAGILHRDVKPGNVLVTADGRVVLSDFGIARLEGDPALTGTGLIMGSPAYMAPERARGDTIGPPSDLWSLGATLYSAVEGRPVFSRDGAVPTLAAVVTDTPDPFRLAGPLAPLLTRLLDRDPSARPSSAEVRAGLERVAATAEGDAPPDRPTRGTVPLREVQRTRALSPPVTRGPGVPRRRVLVLAGVLALVAGLVVAWAASRPDEAARTPVVADSPRASAKATPVQRSSPSPTPPSARPTTAGPSPAAPAAGVAVPAGYVRRSDPSGFSLAVPQGWTVDRQGRFVYFRDQGTGRFLLVDQTNSPKADPVQDWEAQEQARRGGMADYRRVTIEAVDYFLRAADWEFTFTDGGAPLHVRNRGFVTAPDQGYALYFSTPAGMWDASQDEWRVITETFRPRAG
jgi:serine/threonine protein kinase